MSQPQTTCILEIFKDFFGCKNVLVATHQNSQKIQRLFRLQSCPRRKSSSSWKYSKTFLPANFSQQQAIIILKEFKDFSPAKLSWPQIIDILEIFKDFFGCKNVLAANHRNPGNNQRLFRLQTCLSRKSSISWKYSKTFSPAKLSQPQKIDIPEIFKDFFGCKIILVATHQKSENIQGLFRLQNCLSRKSSISWNYSKTFSPANSSQPQLIYSLEIFKSFSPAKLSQQQPIKILKTLKDSFACKVVLAANHRVPGNIQRPFCLQNFLSSNPSLF